MQAKEARAEGLGKEFFSSSLCLIPEFGRWFMFLKCLSRKLSLFDTRRIPMRRLLSTFCLPLVQRPGVLRPGYTPNCREPCLDLVDWCWML